MLKFLKRIWSDYCFAETEMSKMGIWQFPSSNGFWTYVDQETFKKHIESKERKDDNT
jgi:hypothetical protein